MEDSASSLTSDTSAADSEIMALSNTYSDTAISKTDKASDVDEKLENEIQHQEASTVPREMTAL